MGNTRKIPVLKNRVVIKKPKKRSFWGQVKLVALAFVFMLLFVWMKVQSNLKLAEIQKLEQELKQVLAINKKLSAERIRLSSFGRIRKIAIEELGMEFPGSENIIEISPQ